jgi:hypothetical protein
VGNNVVLNLVQPALNDWRHAYFGTYANSGSAADTANPTGDGIVNLMKYATGVSPMVHNSNPPAAMGQMTLSGSGYLTLSFNMIADPDLLYTVEAADDLTSGIWSVIWSSTGASNVAGNVSVVDLTSMDQQTKRFLRLKVSY